MRRCKRDQPEASLTANKGDLMGIGDMVMVRDPWITDDYMIFQAKILSIAYCKNSSLPYVYLIEFTNGKTIWIESTALKIQ